MIPREFNYLIQLGLQNQRLQDLLFHKLWDYLLIEIILYLLFLIFFFSFKATIGGAQ